MASNYINPISKKDEEPINPELIAISYYEIFKTYLYACNKEIFSNYKPTLYSSEVASLKQIVKDRFVGLQTYQGKISREDNVCQVYSVSLLQWMENFSHVKE